MGQVEKVGVEGWRELQEIMHMCVHTLDDCEHAVKAVRGGDQKKKKEWGHLLAVWQWAQLAAKIGWTL